MQDARIGEGVRVLVLGSGKAGRKINAVGVAEARSAGDVSENAEYYAARATKSRKWTIFERRAAVRAG
jgi:transcription elongation GreA/GreB family factor